MITLQPIHENNFLQAASLAVSPEQQEFVASAPIILARAYAYRRQRSVCWGIYEGNRIVGLAMLHDLEEAPACYHLCEFFIDAGQQGKGYGQQALGLILAACRREGKFPRVEVCVKKADTAAIHVYKKAGFRDSGYTDPDAPDSLCMVCALPENSGAPDIRPTTRADLENVRNLWANPEVMCFVGFPEGLQETLEYLESDWLPWVQCPPRRQHYSVCADTVGYCGEAFYDVDETGLACMDIKLLPCARGRGIAYAALSHALEAAFREGGAKSAYVDPSPENHRALKLYASLGFLPAQRPAHLEDPGCPYVYLEMTRENWELRRKEV